MSTDRPAKIARLHAVLDAHRADALTLTRPENLAWLFDGARVTVPWGGPAVLAARVDRDGGIEVIAPANEADRLRDEELGAGIELSVVPWHEPFAARAGDRTLTDTEVATEMRAARASLLPGELGRYRALGADMAACATRVLTGARPTMTERDLAARIAHEVIAAGAEPVVLLVAGETRARVQHPLPTASALGGRCLVAIGARRHGLIANLTRTASFGAPDPAGSRGLLEVEADAVAATVPGRAWGEVLTEIARSYERHGLARPGWLGHHQGGPTGYLGRDPKVVPGETEVVRERQAFAWNPWIPGAKREDTMVSGPDGHEVLTTDPDWPAVETRGVARPATLELR